MINNFNELIAKYGKIRDLPIEIVKDLRPVIDELILEFRTECHNMAKQLIEEMEERARIIIASTYKHGDKYSHNMISFIIDDLKKTEKRLNGNYRYVYSYQDIAKRYGISTSSISNIASKNNLSRKKIRELSKDYIKEDRE